MPRNERRGAPKLAAQEGWVLATALKSAPRLLAERGIDPHTVAQRVGFDLHQLDDPENAVSFARAGRFLAECALAARCPHFGLLVGTEEGVSALGVVGHLVQHSRDVRGALLDLTAYLHHQELGGVATLSVERGVAALDYAIRDPQMDGGDAIADCGMGIALSVMRLMCGADWTPIEIQLAHAKPKDVMPYRRVVGAPVQFGAERNALLFHERWLDHRLQGADPNLRRILESAIAALEARRSANFPDRVRTVIRTGLLAGQCSSDDVSARLAMSRRTLHRRLAADGATYEDLVDETRFDLARQLLSSSRASMAEIAAALNYANASAFTRAFRRWAEVAPSAWRDAARPQP